MATTYTLLDLKKQVLSTLNEASDSPVGEFHAGDGSSAVVSTSDTITRYLNDACYDLARYAYPLSGKGSFTVNNNQRVVPLSSVILTGGATLWAARQVQFAGNPIERANRSYAEIYYPEYATEGTGVTKFWYFDGSGAIALAPIPASGGVLTVSGLITPAPLVADTDALTWLQPDLYKLIVYYAVYMIAYKNLENDSLKERAPLWQKAWSDGKSELLSNLSVSDPRLYRAHFLTPGQKAG